MMRTLTAFTLAIGLVFGFAACENDADGAAFAANQEATAYLYVHGG